MNSFFVLSIKHLKVYDENKNPKYSSLKNERIDVFQIFPIHKFT